MTVATPEQIGGKNVAAFLDCIAFSEGTDNGRQPTKCLGYDVMVGGGLFTDFTKHPEIVVQVSASLRSSAAGRYQFLRRTWGELAAFFGLNDFMPLSQDLAAVHLLKRRGAYGLAQMGRFDEAVAACRKEWASLPGAGYKQHEQKIERLRAAYLEAGGLIGKAQ